MHRGRPHQAYGLKASLLFPPALSGAVDRLRGAVNTQGGDDCRNLIFGGIGPQQQFPPTRLAVAHRVAGTVSWLTRLTAEYSRVSLGAAPDAWYCMPPKLYTVPLSSDWAR